MYFEILGLISQVEIIAVGQSIREHRRLKKMHGTGRWRKLKGLAAVRFSNGKKFKVELHWYEAHGVGRREYKIKRIVEPLK